MPHTHRPNIPEICTNDIVKVMNLRSHSPIKECSQNEEIPMMMKNIPEQTNIPGNIPGNIPEHPPRKQSPMSRRPYQQCSVRQTVCKPKRLTETVNRIGCQSQHLCPAASQKVCKPKRVTETVNRFGFQKHTTGVATASFPCHA